MGHNVGLALGITLGPGDGREDGGDVGIFDGRGEGTTVGFADGLLVVG